MNVTFRMLGSWGRALNRDTCFDIDGIAAHHECGGHQAHCPSLRTTLRNGIGNDLAGCPVDEMYLSEFVSILILKSCEKLARAVHVVTPSNTATGFQNASQLCIQPS